ncbi:zinc finger ZZ-type and EF-hand domain-containing protein 1 isoform X5 [Gadus morhua]|uniref:zinc finger ZZ-type and EF-hand domain-containing protein 1 isoform X5 n=1 Tax=Gadus morhua TaxID=8049 RepID=UPI0011B70940|nr:zinc finger ZZ-type and EF-hand domain-containing protein 1 isoform X5 [Gadus morhua]
MGNAESGVAGASGDEEDVEAESPGFAEDSPASAATGVGAGTAGGSGSGKSGRPTINNPPSTNGPPTPGVLLEQVKLREAAARISDSGLAIPESVLAGNEIALMRWLEDRLSRGEESVNVEQFCEMLEIRNAPRDECEEAFGQFDTEGDGVVDVESMLSALKNSNGANLQGELSHVIRHLQACSLTPGFVDIFSKYKDELGAHASKILKFLHRNRIPSSAIPFPLLEGYNSICTMRSTLVQNFLEFLLQKEKDLDIQYRAELIRDPDVDKVKVVTQCFSFIEASSNATDIHRMTDGETGSFWQSDGSARSHWIRLKMKPDVVLRRLAIAVASNDHSYMPQLVSVAVGKNRRSLQEIRDIRIPSNVTGYVALLENANITHPYIQINIKRCLSDGCDTRIHGLKTLGYQITKSKEVSVSDASAIWYLSLLTSLVTASMETNPVLAQTVLQSTQKALRHMPPLSLTPSSTEFPKFFSANILEEVDGFLLRIADCCVSPEAELTLLAFALARGSVAKVLQALSGISEHLETEYRASSLISSMASVRMRLLYRNGKPLQLHLQACDVKSKEEKSGPENMLAEPTTGDGFLTESGKKRASIILSTEDQSNFQVTQMKVKVRKGATGAKCGLVFAYKEANPFDAEKHFDRFKKFDLWDYDDYKDFVQDNVKLPAQSEDQPIGWFELEEDWNDVEIKLQQCRIAKFLMVKFLCTRQTSAERLGVQSLCFHGYLVVGAERLGDAEELLPDGGEGPEDLATTGQMLLNKTLFFIQQLTRDMDVSQFKQKFLLDFIGLSLTLFWSLYSKLMQIEGEEVMKSRVLLLQLLQNCFPMLQRGASEGHCPDEGGGPEEEEEEKDEEKAAEAGCSSSSGANADPPHGAVLELYTHLCQVVDRPETEALVEKALRREAVKALLSGAAIFFPDKHSRRDKLFHMMNITEEDQPESVKVTFESLCNYFSDQDPSGLLLLPPKEVSTDFDISPILSVMETLLLVATRECEVMMGAVSGGPSRTVLLSLFWALQGSLLSWCYLQLKADTSGMGAQLARDIVVKYVNQFLGSAQGALASLLERYSGAEITEKLSSSILATVTRQLMIFLLELCSLDIPHSVLLKSFSSLVELLKNLSSDTGDIFSKVDQESCLQPQQPVVLRTWNMESPHNYENSRHETTIFCCPGATSFVVEFDERCQTEKRYDYLEFTDARGGKVRYDTKIGTEKWPKKVTFDAGPQLQFLFHSDSSNNEWGYKFSVTAQGLPDITVSWMSDVQLLVARLMGRLASRAMALKSPHEIRSVKELPPGRMAHVQSSPLWKPILRHGACDARDTPQNNTPSVPVRARTSPTITSPVDEFPRFLEDLARWNPNLEPNEGPAEPMRTLMLSCRRPPIRNEIAAGSTVDQAVNAIWAAMVYHTPALHQALKAHVAQGYKSSLSEDFVQVYTLADRIRTWMLETKQRHLVSKMNAPDEKEGAQEEVTMEALAEVCIQKSLLLLRFPPSGDTSGPAEGSSAPLLLRSCSVSEGDFQPTTSPVAATASAAAAAAAPLALALAQAAEPPSESEAGTVPEGGQQNQTAADAGLSSQTEEPAGPPSASSVPRRPIRRTLGRVRLLSYRSVEEPRTVLSVRERYPILKHLLNFMKDQALTTGSVLQTLALNKAQAQSVCRVLESVQQGLLSLGKPHLFQAPCILFLQELLACQKDFNGYFSQLSGSGQELREEVRRSYHQLVLMLVEAVQGFSGLNEKALLPALSCVQTCLLHLLDMSWEPQDLPLFLDIKLPDLLLNMSQENISVHDIAISQWTEEDEIAVYKKNQEWMDECADGMFEKWYDKIGEEGSVEDRRKMHRFIARYCDLLNVVISCDGCERIAPWHRYRCLQCMDMDLCKTCFLSGAKPEGHEDDHEMVNMEYACDHCQGLIVGSRINCNVCEDFDLCFGCYNAKKYPDSHLPTHRITVFPMVTIRISDRHRLIQPYIHNYSWLLFAALALYTSALASERRLDGEPLKTGSLDRALALQGRCSQLITECLLKGQDAKGLRSSALLALLSSNETSSDSELGPNSPESSRELSTADNTDNSSLPGSTAAVCSPTSPQDTSKTSGKETSSREVVPETPTVAPEPPAKTTTTTTTPTPTTSPTTTPTLTTTTTADSSTPTPPGPGDDPKGRRLVQQDTLDSPTLSQTPSVSSEDPLSPVVRPSEPTGLALAASPASEPTGLALAASPASEPTGLAAAASPASEPTGLALAASPASEPTGLAAAASPASEPTGLALAASPASEPTGLAAAASPASEPTGLAAAASPASEAGKEQAERLSQAPRQDHVFSDCSRERILGLLAAMLPPAKPGCGLSLPSLSSILPQLFRVVVSNAGCLDETYHLTLGLLGQLLLRIPPAEADGAVGEALADKYELLAQLEAAGTETPGWKTTQLLFCLGAVCLDSRIGLDWACSVADILRGLNACPQWSVVIAAFTDHCVQQLPHTLRRTNLFTLLVLVGFPEVLCMGTQSVFVDNANEQHHMILLKHFTEKNHAAVVDVKTRKRKTVKDYQLIQPQDSSWAGLPAQAEGQPAHKALISRYLDSFISIISHLLKGSPDPGSPDAVEASWVLSLALKGLYNTLKKQGVEEAQQAIQRSGLTQLLVRKCSKGTGFSKLWLLRDLEILSVMLYSSKREIHSMTQDPERDEREPEPDREQDSDHSSCCTEEPRDPSRPDPLEGLDEETKICFQITHDALNAPLHILRAMYELQMKRTDSFFLEVQKRFDGDVIKTDETIRTLAQKWQPSRRPRSERTTKAVDTDMIVVSCVAKPSHCERATEEINLVAQKLITSSEGDLQLSYAKQRRTKSSALLHKELDARSNRAVRQYLVKVNQAIATLYARHVLAALLAEWPAGQPLSDEALELSGSSHMAYILDMLVQLEEKTLWEKILQRVLKGCGQSMLCSLSLTACQFMEEPGMAVQIRESKHPYDNNTNFEDKVHIPGAIYLSVKFDPRCHSEEGCDELIMSSSADFLQDLHTFSGSPQKWSDFEIPGDTLYYKFVADMSNTEWGYKFTVTGGHRGRFQTGFEILKQMLADEAVLSHLPLSDIWEWQVGVACRQTGTQRLKAIHLLLRLLQCQSQTACELMLLRPLWQLFVSMETTLCQDPACITVLLPLHRALTELFFIAESRATAQGILQEYLLAMTTDQQLLNHTAMALKNIAAISLAINYPNKSTKLLSMPS